jgi:hypothetical protein
LKRGLVWEQPIGVVQGVLEEPEAGYVDPHDAEEREAIQWLEHEGKMIFNQTFEEWLSGDRMHGGLCDGVFRLYHWQWCNQLHIRCDTCNAKASDQETGVFIGRALPHVLAREIYSKYDIGFVAFPSRDELDSYYADTSYGDYKPERLPSETLLEQSIRLTTFLAGEEFR